MKRNRQSKAWTIKSKRILKNWAVPLGCGLLFLFLLNAIFFIGIVPSSSMEPTIRKGSIIFGVKVYGDPQRGDVVVFEHEGTLLVKRIAGMPSDLIHLDGRVLFVPNRCYFMLGDNSEGSMDSRYWDEPFVPRGSIIAKVWLTQ